MKTKRWHKIKRMVKLTTFVRTQIIGQSAELQTLAAVGSIPPACAILPLWCNGQHNTLLKCKVQVQLLPGGTIYGHVAQMCRAIAL